MFGSGLRRLLCVALMMWMLPAPVALAIGLEAALETRGTVLLLRHALAPGYGDPDHFRVDDCSTQRNLSAAGVRQAERLGERLRAHGYRASPVYSSPWCRCLDTATAMAVGPVVAHDGLASYFEDHVDREATLQSLDSLFRQLPEEGPPVLMVTHQVVIGDVTGRYPGSGEAVLFDPRERKAWPVTGF